MTPNWVDAQKPWAELVLGFEWGGLGTRTNAKVTDRISSRHGGIIVASFCDGHTAQLNEQLDINVFKHIMTPYGCRRHRFVRRVKSPTNLLDEAFLP